MQRTRLERAMISVVAETGYSNTTVAAVIERAGISRATFYELFDDKEDCFLAAHEQLLLRLRERVDTAYRGEALWPDRVRAGLEALLGFFAEHPHAADVAFVEALAAGRRARQRCLRAIREYGGYFEEGRRLLHDADLPEAVPQVAVGAAATVLFEAVTADRVVDLPRLLPEVVYVALVPYLGHERALAQMRLASEQTGQDSAG